MIWLYVLIGGVLLMCRARSTVTQTIPADYAVPVPPANDGDSSALTTSGYSEARVSPDAAPLQDYDQSVDPWQPVPTPTSDPSIVNREPETLDRGTVILSTPEYDTTLSTSGVPLKDDPIVRSTPPNDFYLPVPETDYERGLSGSADYDASFPVPSPVSDPALYAEPAELAPVPVENVMENWTATTTEDTEACYDTALELSW